MGHLIIILRRKQTLIVAMVVLCLCPFIESTIPVRSLKVKGTTSTDQKRKTSQLQRRAAGTKTNKARVSSRDKQIKREEEYQPHQTGGEINGDHIVSRGPEIVEEEYEPSDGDDINSNNSPQASPKTAAKGYVFSKQSIDNFQERHNKITSKESQASQKPPSVDKRKKDISREDETGITQVPAFAEKTTPVATPTASSSLTQKDEDGKAEGVEPYKKKAKIQDEKENKDEKLQAVANDVDEQLVDASIVLTHFSLIYDIQETPEDNDFQDALRVTIESMQPFLFYVLDDSLDSFTLNSDKWSMTSDGPRIDFTANVKFIEGAEPLHDIELLELIQKSFTEVSFLDHYIRYLQQLDQGNPFHETNSIQFHSMYADKHHAAEIRMHMKESKTEVGVLFSFAGVAVVLSIPFLFLMRSWSPWMATDHAVKKVVASNINASREYPSIPLRWMPQYWLEHDDTEDTLCEAEDDGSEPELRLVSPTNAMTTWS